MEARKNYTVAEGIAVQTENLRQWKGILKPEVFERIKALAITNNHTATTGYDICRGSDISNLVENELINIKQSK